MKARKSIDFLFSTISHLILLTFLFLSVINVDIIFSHSLDYELVSGEEPLYEFTAFAVLLDEELSLVRLKF
uniref:Uncharacterized protein n=1 Tax=Ignisphaera aggregans TaxID=334771 RepID=A0A7C4BBK9_9CREN